MNQLKLSHIYSGVLVLFAFTFSQNANALYPQAYLPAPADKHLYLVYYEHIDTDGRYSNGDKQNSDLSAARRIFLFRYAYYFDWAGERFLINTGLPVGKATLEGSAIGDKQESDGIADPFVNGVVFFVNQPANKLWMALSEYLFFPLGDYDNKRNINLGENRAKSITELGLIKGWGQYFLDVTTNITLYSDNTEFGAANDTLKQDPLFGFETHITRQLTANNKVSIGGLWQWGGESQVNGVERNDEQRKRSLQISYDHKIAANKKLALFYKKDLEVENGFKVNHLSLRFHVVF